MSKKILSIIFSMLLVVTSIVTIADWDPEDGHKMHFPQLPDPTGWDVHATIPMICADDWMCSETGYVKDIHFWGSWLGDDEGTVTKFKIWIYNDIPVGNNYQYSRPGKALWYREIIDFQIRGPYEGTQGWFWPELNEWNYPDHYRYYQYNVFLDQEDWFPQEEGTIYWLVISAVVEGNQQWGWKSSNFHWNDDACWAYVDEFDWIDLWEPPYDPVMDSFNAMFSADNDLIQGGGTGFEGVWFYYPETFWWNMWFYNEPFDDERMKRIDIDVIMQSIEPGAPSFITFAINWATPEWSELGNQYPPIPPIENEDRYIERDILYEGSIDEPTEFEFTYYIRDYNPEWVSIDIMGQFFMIDGTIEHTCFQSLDQAFVINGDEGGEPSINVDKKVSNDGGITWSDEVDVELDETVKFKITVENNGDIDFSNVLITDTLPGCLEYISGSASPVEPSVSGNKLTWIYSTFSVGLIKEIIFDAKAIEEGENINLVEVLGRTSIGTEFDDNDTATVYVGPKPIPKISCGDDLRWSDVTPGITMIGTTTVKNIGEAGSQLKWSVCAYPTNWGTWSFNPQNGLGLKPSDPPVTITVTVISPNQQNQQYSGQIKLCNEEDSSDTCTILVSLATPKNKIVNIGLLFFLERLAEKFPAFETLLKYIYWELGSF